jgi:hypothetical protein
MDKLDFLEAYPSARIEAFKSETIKNSFTAAGLVPYDPDRVILKLDIHLRTRHPARAGEASGRRKRRRTTSSYRSLVFIAPRNSKTVPISVSIT